MKLWKCAAIAFTLLGAALSLLLTRNMVPSALHHLPSWEASTLQTSSNSSSLLSRHPRKVRSAEGIGDMLTEFMHMFQSFTEGELKEVIGILVEKKARQEASQSKRTKRAKKASKPCSLRRVEVTISELGLGYESDETLYFQYCSGSCMASRRNYDLILMKWKKKGISKRDRGPCCRPNKYDEISVLDNSNKYKSLHEFSALGCECV